ncbi:MAG: TIR domain-containing protein [Minwuia sp.]|uniref:TIR domain-containing protein n=1 Tax=Minwuia sp. TaxID=2493630 RepID=UPI003A8AFF63
MAEPGYRFAGFISYSQKDKSWAKRIHRALETYRLPVGLPGADPKRRKLGRFFRDDDELAGEPSLGRALEGALEDSRTLVVICSPNAAKSKWVDAEVRHFKSRGPDTKILAVIVGGKPDSDDPDVMCFPPSLLRKVGPDGELTDEPDEPLAPDAQKESFPRLVARLVAGIVGVRFDELWQREKRRRRRRAALVAVGALAIAAAGVAQYIFYQDTERKRLAEESRNHAAEAQQAMNDGRFDEALEFVLDALPSDLASPERPLVPEAAAALRRLMGGNPAAGVLADFGQPVDDLRLVGDDLIAVRLNDSSIQVLDRVSGEVRQRLAAEDGLDFDRAGRFALRTYTDERTDAGGVLRMTHTVNIRDLETGRIERDFRHDDIRWYAGPWAAVSPDRRRIVVQASLAVPEDEQNDLAVWELPDAPGGQPMIVARIRSPFADDDSLVRHAFVSNDAVVMFHGRPRSRAAYWNLATGDVRILWPADSPTPCGAPRDEDRRKQDSLILSGNGGLISHAMPMLGGGWCVGLWEAASGEMHDPIEVDVPAPASFDAVDQDTLVVVGHSAFADNGVWRRGAEYLTEIGCGAGRSSGLDAIVDDARWRVMDGARWSVCSIGTDIRLQTGHEMDFELIMQGHKQDVSALAVDQRSGLIYSGSADGTVRIWDTRRLARPVPLPGRALEISSWGEKVAVLHHGADGTDVRVFTASGEPLGRPVPVPIAGLDADPPIRGRLKLAAFALAGNAVLTVESWDCGMLGCPRGTPRRAVLGDVSNGAGGLVLEDLAAGGFLERMPAALDADAARNRLVGVRRDGGVFSVDVSRATVTEYAVPDGLEVSQAVWAGDNIWAVADDSADEPSDRREFVLRLGDDGFEIAGQDRAQRAQLFAAGDGHGAIVSLDVIHATDSRPLYRLIQNGELSPAFAMPFARAVGEQLQHARFFADGRKLALFFSDNTVPPQTIELPERGGELPAGIGNLAPVSPASLLDPWRSDDPHARAVVSTGGDVFTAHPLGQDAILCSELHGKPASAVAFDPDGGHLAVSGGEAGDTRIHAVDSCDVLQAIPMEVAHNGGRMVFGDAAHLWLLSDAGDARIQRLETNLAELHRRALELHASMHRKDAD